jgi:hypothetical protein
VADYNASTGRESTFGRSLMNYVNNHLPYQSYTVLDTISKLNPKFKEFQDTGSKRTEALARQSISSSTDYNNLNPGAFFNIDNSFTQYMYANIQADKISRLRDYRIMAAFPEVADALDEICDESFSKDDSGLYVRLKLTKEDIQKEIRKKVEEEFQRYIDYFELDRKGWEMIRSLLVDGEVYFEHIIHEKYPEEGILGVVLIPSELIDPIFGNVQNMLVKGFLLRKPVFDKTNPTKIVDYQMIPMDKNQVTYINSGIWNENKTIRLPFIENARRAYRQLSLIEDSIVIYRLARAPERLVFNVDVGNMSPPKAESYIKKLMNQYWSKRTFDADQGGQVRKFNPQSYLDNYWFAKRAGSDGTRVEQLQGGQNLGELKDLNYFLEKLYRSLKVPLNRLNKESAYNDSMSLLREELKFAKFIVRCQQHLAEGFKNGFITHLKLKGLWEKFDLKETYIEIEFTPPTNFFEMREVQKLEIKANAFNLMTQNESISKTYAQKKYLKWTDVEVLANKEFLRKDKEFEWELGQIQANGPNWKTGTAPAPEGAEPAAVMSGAGAAPTGMPGAEGGAAGGTPGGEEVPPPFGPAPAAPAAAPAGPAPGAPPPPGNAVA